MVTVCDVAAISRNVLIFFSNNFDFILSSTSFLCFECRSSNHISSLSWPDRGRLCKHLSNFSSYLASAILDDFFTLVLIIDNRWSMRIYIGFGATFLVNSVSTVSGICSSSGPVRFCIGIRLEEVSPVGSCTFVFYAYASSWIEASKLCYFSIIKYLRLIISVPLYRSI